LVLQVTAGERTDSAYNKDFQAARAEAVLRAEAAMKCHTCNLRLRCTLKYGREAMQILDNGMDPTIPTARELDAQWGFRTKGV
jgi:hypothetical protein